MLGLSKDNAKTEELKEIDEKKKEVEEKLKKIETPSKEKEGMGKICGIFYCLAFLFLWVVMMLLVRIGAGEGFFILCLPSLLFLMIPFEYLFNKIAW